MKPLFIIVFCLPLYSLLASSATLVEEFLSSGLQLQIDRLDYEVLELNRDALRASKSYSLDGAYTIDDNNLEPATSGFNSNQIETDTFSLGLSKSFEWGTSLSFDNTLTKQDRSKLSSLLSSSDPILYEFSQSITISQDLGDNIFGKEFYLQLRALNSRMNLGKIELSEKNEMELYKFYNLLLKAKQAKTLLKISKEALGRSQKRRTVTARRVRDGLNEKADLLQAELDVEEKKEALINVEFGLRKAKNALSQILLREVNIEELEEVNFEKEVLSKKINYDEADIFDLNKIERKIDIIKIEKEEVDRAFIPTVTLSTTYQTNEYDDKSSDSFKDGNFTSDNDEITIALSVSTPLTFESEKVSSSLKSIELQRAQLEKRQVLQKVKAQKDNLSFQLESNEKNLRLSKTRIRKARANLNESNRLYRIGRVDLDRLIRAEETLLQTQKSYVDNWYSFELSVAEEASWYGKLLISLKDKYQL